MKIFDISWPISPEMTAYKDKKVVEITHTKTFDKDYVRESLLTIGAHSGTHIDAPSHFLKDGISIDQQPVYATCGPCKVFDVTHVDDAIMPTDLVSFDMQEGDIILFKTKNSDLESMQPFTPNFVYLHHTAAAFLAHCKVQAVGIDYLGIERNQPEHETHIILMKNNCAIIEGLRLAGVAAGDYFLWCVPLALTGTEAAPARAILIQE
jgi:arylformamidase